MPRLLFSQLSLGEEANRVLLITSSRLKASVDAVVKDCLELLVNVHERLPESWVAVPFPALLVWLSDKLYFLACTLLTRGSGTVVVLCRSSELFFPDDDFLSQVLVKFYLLVLQLLHLTVVLLSFLEMLAGEVVLHNLPLLRQVYAILKP